MKTVYQSERSRNRRRAWAMIARSITASVGGYMAAAGITSLFSRLLPVSRVEAATWGMVLSFLIFAMLALWAFHERRLPRLAAVIWGSAALSILIVWLIGTRP